MDTKDIKFLPKTQCSQELGVFAQSIAFKFDWLAKSNVPQMYPDIPQTYNCDKVWFKVKEKLVECPPAGLAIDGSYPSYPVRTTKFGHTDYLKVLQIQDKAKFCISPIELSKEKHCKLLLLSLYLSASQSFWWQDLYWHFTYTLHF